jgi:cell division protease FtsH
MVRSAVDCYLDEYFIRPHKAGEEPRMPSDPTPNSNPNSGKPRRRPSSNFGSNWVWMLLLLGLAFILLNIMWNSTRRLEYSDFVQLATNDKLKEKIKRISGEGTDRLIIELMDDPAKWPEDVRKEMSDDLRKKLDGQTKFTVERFHWTAPQETDILLKLALPKAAEPGKNVQPVQLDQQSDTFASFLTLMMFLAPIILLVALVVFLLPRFRDPLGGGFLSNYIKSPAKRYERSKMRTTFDDVAGMLHAKSELQEVVEFLRSPEKFQRLGAVVPKGVLLVGPPGTGKTLLAKAVAGEAGVPFFSISGSEFIQMFVGVGASRVRDMFKTAKENAPCILFIDEIDAVGRMRGAGVGGGSDEREQTLNQILSEMDGFQPSETVIVMAATNRPDVLDSALLRPGRFDRHVTIDRPTWQGRLAILKVHTRTKPLADNVNLEQIARGMTGMTGADLRNLANEAALLATREGKSKIDRSDFERAADRVLIGAKREEVLTQEEKRRTAYHEAGHALCAWLTPGADPLFKLTIIPRGRSLGMTRFHPEEERLDYTESKLMAQMIVTMGGRAADRLIFQEATSGANSDLKQATRIARMMVTQFGMSERIGPVAYRIGEEHIFLGKEIQEPRDFSEGTAKIIDEEVQRLLREADERAYELLKQNRDKMERLVEALLAREELLRDEVEQLLKETNGVAPTPAFGVTTAPAGESSRPTE